MRVLIPLPRDGHDPTEVAAPWRALRDAGHDVVFATPGGSPSLVDDRMTTGRGLGPWRALLRARAEDVALHEAMTREPAFRAPRPYAALADLDADALVLPGGHAPGMRTLLESQEVRDVVVGAMRARRPVGAICHGVVVMARSIDPESGRSVLHGRRTTALLRAQELSAFALTALWLGRYYRTYDVTVEAEVRAALACDADFVSGPLPLTRDSFDDLAAGFTVRDGNYLSARWPGDAHRFAREFVAGLTEHGA